jgi:hypothetical protein
MAQVGSLHLWHPTLWTLLDPSSTLDCWISTPPGSLPLRPRWAPAPRPHGSARSVPSLVPCPSCHTKLQI